MGTRNRNNGEMLIAIMARIEQMDKNNKEKMDLNDKAHDEIGAAVKDILKSINGNGKPGINGRLSAVEGGIKLMSYIGGGGVIGGILLIIFNAIMKRHGG